ncbi:hypothetical protein KIW84_053181 [Lathyrus oleraceus]|uniref:SWIM-type domain-containing protein n=1 Tax=Pisum sativum TaxID=3888 RepID=A0A9D4WS27_PEA|nr:hypothetical protein KIW84_053181 [Pisum sativum]
MGYPGVLKMCYDFADTLKELINDFSAIELLNWSKTHDKGQHNITETDIVEGQHDIPKTDITEGQQSDDNALGCRFDDSDDEVLNDGIDEVLVGVRGFVAGENDQEVDELKVDDASKGKKVRVVDLRKKKDKGSFNKKKGRPCKQMVEEAISVENEPSSDEDTIDFGFVERRKGKVVDRGLSDSDYIYEKLETDEDSSSDYSDKGSKEKYPSFVMPKKFVDYKWVLGDKFTVDLKQKERSCKSWMLTGIPCYHAIACIQSRAKDPADYIPTMYTMEAYQACYRLIIYLTNGQYLWEETPYSNILPPPSRRAPGRPKRRRNKDADEKRKDTKTISRKGLPNKCSGYGKSGHNKASCPTAPSQPASSQPASF